MSTLSTHVLDAALGRPAVGIPVVVTGPDGSALADQLTDSDGRVRFTDLELAPGPYTLTFATGPWFTAQERKTLYPNVIVSVDVSGGEEHYHIAVLLSPYSYTTYRGS